MSSGRTVAGLSAALILAAAAGCATGPDYVRPAMDDAAASGWTHLAAGGDPADHAGPAALTDRWWQAFGDTALDGLVEAALRHNPDLQQAAARVLEARAGVTAATSARWPALEVGGSASRSQTSEAMTLFGPTINESYAATATARWELDLWGRLSRGHEASVALLLASEETRRAATQSLVANVVRTWLLAREMSLQVALSERTVVSYERSLETVRDRYRSGLVGPLDVHLAGQNLAAARAQTPAYRQQLHEARRALELLTGRYPAGAALEGAAASGELPEPLAAVPAGLPSELLDRRPDLLAAEARLMSEVAGIGQAKAALYPRISLTADGGSRSRELGDLFQDGTSAWSLVGNLVMPLLNRGAATSQVAAAEAQARGAVAAYRGAVLAAFAEVENALDQEVHQAEQEAHLTESVARARRSLELAEDRYRRGLDGILTTLETQRRLSTAESGLLSVQRQRRTARVNLILALGGPWDRTVAPVEIPNVSQGAQP